MIKPRRKEILISIIIIFFIISMILIKDVYSFNKDQALLIKPASERLDFKNVYGVFIGVDKFKYRVSRVPIFTRKRIKKSDKLLYDNFLAKGMNKNNSVLLIDEQANINDAKKSIIEILKKTTPNSTFVFYYAGYSYKKDNQRIIECYDSRQDNIFEIDFISNAIKQYFKGDKVFIFADGIKSNLLIEAAKKASNAGKKAIALTSVDMTNNEITNWIFSQSLVDTFNGNIFADLNNDNIITLEEFVYEIYNITKYFNYEKISFYNSGFPAGFVMTNAIGTKPVTPTGSKFKAGDYVLYGSSVLRIKKFTSGRVFTEAYIDDYKKEARAISRSIKPLDFPQFNVGTIIEVSYNHNWYPVKVLKRLDEFHLISYGNRGEGWNEWVMHNRIQEVKYQSNLYVLYQNKYYAAKILKQEGDRYYITYPGYNEDWNEWVTKERMIFF